MRSYGTRYRKQIANKQCENPCRCIKIPRTLNDKMMLNKDTHHLWTAMTSPTVRFKYAQWKF